MPTTSVRTASSGTWRSNAEFATSTKPPTRPIAGPDRRPANTQRSLKAKFEAIAAWVDSTAASR